MIQSIKQSKMKKKKEKKKIEFSLLVINYNNAFTILLYLKVLQ